MERHFLTFLPQFKAFGIADEKITEFENNGIIPELTLAPEAYKLLYIPQPKDDAPTVAFLLGRERNYYTIDWNYARAIAKSGVKMRFLDYTNTVAQLEGCQGIILPGGSFTSPEEYYIDANLHSDNIPSSRAQAYISCILAAQKNNLPMLGICAGAQMIGGFYGMKMYRDLENIERPVEIEHKTTKDCAHKILMKQGSSLRTLMGNIPWLWVNSRHKESMVPDDNLTDLEIYAVADDNIPEAWGNEELNILCIQWHPEDFAAHGNPMMQRIFIWMANKAAAYAG